MRHFFDLFMRGYEGPLAPLFSWGWHGVDLFFALSGFLIGGQIIEECRSGKFSFGQFFIKRSFRIIPPYFFAIAVFVAVSSYMNGFLVLRNNAVFKDVLVHSVYLQDYISPLMYNGIYWSLAVEEKFYLVLPLVIFFFYFIFKTKKNRILLLLLGALALLGIGIRFMTYETGEDFRSAYLVPFHGRFDNLLIGVIAAFLFIHFRERILSAGKYAPLLLAAICLILSFFYGGYGTSYFNVCWQFTLTGVGFSALILWLVLIDAGRFLPFRKVFSVVSKYSYTMYLYHLLILGLTRNWLMALLARFGGGIVAVALVFFIYFAAVTAVSMAIYAVIDRPFMNYRKRLLMKKDKQAQAAEVVAVS